MNTEPIDQHDPAYLREIREAEAKADAAEFDRQMLVLPDEGVMR